MLHGRTLTRRLAAIGAATLAVAASGCGSEPAKAPRAAAPPTAEERLQQQQQINQTIRAQQLQQQSRGGR
jgi:hypothetical protein